MTLNLDESKWVSENEKPMRLFFAQAGAIAYQDSDVLACPHVLMPITFSGTVIAKTEVEAKLFAQQCLLAMIGESNCLFSRIEFEEISTKEMFKGDLKKMMRVARTRHPVTNAMKKAGCPQL